MALQNYAIRAASSCSMLLPTTVQKIKEMILFFEDKYIVNTLFNILYQ